FKCEDTHKWVDMSCDVLHWKLKDGAPEWARKDFEAFMKSVEKECPTIKTEDGRIIRIPIEV
ncbi:MAG: hypothetical protein J6332_08405, partial [Abditibacteriota bacterium]|nr:hypothetical protein [Abditibacteriota bacterium]